MYIGKMYYKGKEATPLLRVYCNNNSDKSTKQIYINQTGFDILCKKKIR